MGAEFQVKEFIVNVWEVRKQKLYGDDSCPNQLQSQSSPGGLGSATGVEGQRDGKLYCVCYACRVSVAACSVLMEVHVYTCGCKCKCDNVHSCMDTCTWQSSIYTQDSFFFFQRKHCPGWDSNPRHSASRREPKTLRV